MKQAVDTQSINLPSPAFMSTMMRMVDESLAAEHAQTLFADPHRYLEAVMVYTHLTLNSLTAERRRELSQMEGSTGEW